MTSNYKTLLSGGDIVTRGAITAGVRFFAGYPITPASVIYETAMREMTRAGGISVGASDEISAISYCIGASLRGIKSMTATSAPGFSLMVESIAYALMAEIPITVVLVQRLGPSTGSATTSDQGDLLLSAFSSSGSYPIPVISPSSIEESYEFIIHTINISEKYRTPVIFLTEKDMVMTKKSIDTSKFKTPSTIERENFKGNGEYLTYLFVEKDIPPPFSPVGGEYLVRYTGSSHDKSGILKKIDPEVVEVLEHLKEKILSNVKDFFFYEHKRKGSKVLLVSYGITSGSLRVVFEEEEVDILLLKTLYPLYEEKLKDIFHAYERVIVIEENPMGSLYILLRHLLRERGLSYTRIGSLISPREIKDFLEDVRT